MSRCGRCVLYMLLPPIKCFDQLNLFGHSQDTRKKEEKLGRVFADEGDVMEEHERDKVEQNALQVSVENPSLPMREGTGMVNEEA